MLARFNKLQAEYDAELSKYARVKETVGLVATRYTSKHEELILQIESVRSRITSEQKTGVPLTEFEDSLTLLMKNEALNRLSPAERMLLKRAYRKAAALAHPDRGGTDTDMSNLTALYELGDIGAVNHWYQRRVNNYCYLMGGGLDYLLECHGILESKLATLQASDVFTNVVQPHMVGNHTRANEGALELLQNILQRELTTLRSLNNGIPTQKS